MHGFSGLRRHRRGLLSVLTSVASAGAVLALPASAPAAIRPARKRVVRAAAATTHTIVEAGTELGGVYAGRENGAQLRGQIQPATVGAPSVTTLEALPITPTAAVLALAVNPDGEETSFRIEIGRASSQWCATEGSSGSAEYTGALHTIEAREDKLYLVLIELGGLTSGVEYCYEGEAENATASEYGAQVAFTSGAPTPETESVSAIEASAATIDGEVDPASQTTYYDVEYGRASSSWCSSEGESGSPEGSTSPVQLTAADEEFHSVSVRLEGLQSNTEYCAALAAYNNSGSTEGEQVTFTTSRAPRAKALKAFATGRTTATFEGEIDPEEQATSYEVEYAPSGARWCMSGGAYGSRSVGTPTALGFTDSSYHAVTVQLSGLHPEMGYCADLVAIGSSGTVSSGQLSFATPLPPLVIVTIEGSGSGTVSGGEISCPGSCVQLGEAGTNVVLTAVPATGSTFTGWSNACTGAGACEATFSETHNVNVVATFARSVPATEGGGTQGEASQGGGSSGKERGHAGGGAMSSPTCRILDVGKKVGLVRRGSGKAHRGKRRRRGKKDVVGQVRSVVSCDQGANVRVAGKLVVARRRRGHGRHRVVFRLAAAKVHVRAGANRRVVLRIPSRALRAMRGNASAQLTVRLGAGNSNGHAGPVVAHTKLEIR